MAHKTLISGTAYAVKGGRELISGTGYDCKAGKTLIGGTAFTVPFSKGIPLNTITPGAILYLNESGSPVPFYIAKHDYESGLNGAGRTLLVRKDCYDSRIYANWGNGFKESAINTWLNDAWIKLLDKDIQTAAGRTKFTYLSNNLGSKGTLEQAVFLLSRTEIGAGSSGDGTALDSVVRKKIAVAHINGTAVNYWTRTRDTSEENNVYIITSSGTYSSTICYNQRGSRPAFTLPATIAVTANPDGTYTIAE